ncbi:hypothetical protein MBANPS3_006049 [Mucor bainieri]
MSGLDLLQRDERDPLEIALKRIKPKIYRQVLVQSNTSLKKFNDIIQATMGWTGYHLHQFHTKDGTLITNSGFGDDDFDFLPKSLKEEQLSLDSVLKAKGDTLFYTYDMGDSWDHIITLKEIKPVPKYPQCVGGKRAVPPEDGDEEDYEAFEPEKFDKDSIDRRLAKLQK